jgi:hypothetical protein
MESVDYHKISALFVFVKTHYILWFYKPCKSCDTCLEPGKIDAPKKLDLQTKSAINSNNLQV